MVLVEDNKKEKSNDKQQIESEPNNEHLKRHNKIGINEKLDYLLRLENSPIQLHLELSGLHQFESSSLNVYFFYSILTVVNCFR